MKSAPDDAGQYAVESGDLVRMANDDVPVQTGRFELKEVSDLSYSYLERQGLIRRGRGEAVAVAIVTDGVRRGVLFTNFLRPGSRPTAWSPVPPIL